MKTRFLLASLVALPVILNSAAPVGAQNQPNSNLSFTFGTYQFQARQQQSNGLLRDVIVTDISKSFSGTSTVMQAKFARKGAGTPERWILGNVVTHMFRSDKKFMAETTAKQVIISIDKKKSP
jgi:hypothetical protein